MTGPDEPRARDEIVEPLFAGLADADRRQGEPATPTVPEDAWHRGARVRLPAPRAVRRGRLRVFLVRGVVARQLPIGTVVARAWRLASCFESWRAIGSVVSSWPGSEGGTGPTVLPRGARGGRAIGSVP